MSSVANRPPQQTGWMANGGIDLDLDGQCSAELNELRQQAYSGATMKIVVASIWVIFAWVAYGWTYVPLIIAMASGVVAVNHFSDTRALRTNDCCCASHNVGSTLHNMAVFNTVLCCLAVLTSILAAVQNSGHTTRLVFSIASILCSLVLVILEGKAAMTLKALNVSLAEDPIMSAYLLSKFNLQRGAGGQLQQPQPVVVQVQPMQQQPMYGYPQQQPMVPSQYSPQQNQYPPQQQPGSAMGSHNSFNNGSHMAPPHQEQEMAPVPAVYGNNATVQNREGAQASHPASFDEFSSNNNRQPQGYGQPAPPPQPHQSQPTPPPQPSGGGCQPAN